MNDYYARDTTVKWSLGGRQGSKFVVSSKSLLRQVPVHARRGRDGSGQVIERRTPGVAFTRVAVLFAGLAVTAAGAAIVPVWGDALLIAGFPLCVAGGVRLLDGRSAVVQYGCGPFLGVMLFFAVFVLAESPGAAARRTPTTFIGAQDGQ